MARLPRSSCRPASLLQTRSTQVTLEMLWKDVDARMCTQGMVVRDKGRQAGGQAARVQLQAWDIGE
eukprot:1141682-Pelagomonas_calceolata.AAC.2